MNKTKILAINETDGAFGLDSFGISMGIKMANYFGDDDDKKNN